MAKKKLTKNQKRNQKKKLALKKKTQKQVPLSQSRVSAPGSPPLPQVPTRFAKEQIIRVVYKLLSRNVIDHPDELRRYIGNQSAAVDIPNLLARLGETLDQEERAQAFAFTAMESYLENKTQKALDQCEQALALDPDNIDALRTKLLIADTTTDESWCELLDLARLPTGISSDPDSPRNVVNNELPEALVANPFLRTLEVYCQRLLAEGDFETAWPLLETARHFDNGDMHSTRSFGIICALALEDNESLDILLSELKKLASQNNALEPQTHLLEIIAEWKMKGNSHAAEKLTDFFTHSPATATSLVTIFASLMQNPGSPDIPDLKERDPDRMQAMALFQVIPLLDGVSRMWIIQQLLTWSITAGTPATPSTSLGGWSPRIDPEELYEPIAELTDAFCNEYLDETCAGICRNILTEFLEADLDFERSLLESWAAGIIHFMGKQNKMFAASHPHHFKAKSIADFFEISAATYLKKSATVATELTRRGNNPASLWGVDEPATNGRSRKTAPKKPSRKPARTKAGVPALRLKIALAGIRPPIWRRVDVPETYTLGDLHPIIQIVMGWDDYHLHMFNVRGIDYSTYDPENPFELDSEDEETITVAKAFTLANGKIVYTYDFGDNWEHVITLEKIIEEGAPLACIKARRAAPPEDCGGPWGYESMLESMDDPEDEEYEEVREWYEAQKGHLDPEHVDMDDINMRLTSLSKRLKR